MKYLKTFNESQDNSIEILSSLFPYVEGLEFIGKGKLGKAYMGVLSDNTIVVCKLTNSLSEYFMTRMAMVSNPPHTVKFYDAKVYDESKYLYGIVHEWVSRDAMPSKEVWDLADNSINGIGGAIKLNNKEEKYEFELAHKKITELENHFGGIEIDTLWENWGYDSERNLVIFDLDGNVSRPKYEKFMKTYNETP
jgi:hypothetical protein